MSENSNQIPKNIEDTPLISDSLPNTFEGILAEAGREVVLKFGTVSEYLPDFAPSFFKDGKPTRRWEAMVAHLAQYDNAGLLENAADVLDAIRVHMAEGNAIQIMDMIHSQLNRLKVETKGTWDGKDVFRIKSIVDAMAKANRACQEIKDSAGFSRVARRQVGIGGQNELERLLITLDKAVSQGSESVDMSELLAQRAVVRAEISEQGSLLEDAQLLSDDSSLTRQEMDELAGLS